MEKINLKCTEREELGKEAMKKLRSLGLTPAVVYKGNHSTNIKMITKDFLQVIHTKAGENVIVNLQLEGTNRARNAIIKEVQYHPIKGEVLHVDFNEISLSEALTVKVPIAVKGEAEGVKEGGNLEHVLWEIEVECLPTDIPENVHVDVSALKIGDSILVKDLKIPPQIKVLSDSEATVIAMAAPRAEEAEEARPEGEEAAEPEVIREKKPEEEEAPAEGGLEAQKKPEPKKQKE